MVATGRARLFRRKDNKYLIYLPKDMCEDSQFPCVNVISVPMKASFNREKGTILLEPLKGEQ